MPLVAMLISFFSSRKRPTNQLLKYSYSSASDSVIPKLPSDATKEKNKEVVTILEPPSVLLPVLSPS